jgi:hypothetical protein
MKLKKKNEKLREGLVKTDNRGQYFTERNFSALKKLSGLCGLSHQKEWEIHNHCYQCDPAISLWRTILQALIIVEDKAKVLEMEAIFEKSERHTDLVVYGVHDRRYGI